MQTITFQNPCSLKIIRNFCFDSSQLEVIDLPIAVQKIESYAFAYWTKLRSVIIQSKIDRIKSCLFYDCQRLEYLSAHDSVLLKNEILDITRSSIESIGENAFMNVPLKKVILPNYVDIKSIVPHIKPTTQLRDHYFSE
jgi:hypothetical protein